MNEQDLENLKKIPYEERITRIENLIQNKEPRAFELGLLLALKMGNEIREKKPLGSETSDLVANWTNKYPKEFVEEAIAHAKEFLIHPTEIAEKIKNTILTNGNQKSNESNNDK